GVFFIILAELGPSLPRKFLIPTAGSISCRARPPVTESWGCKINHQQPESLSGLIERVTFKITAAALEKTLADGDLVTEKINDQELVFLPSLKGRGGHRRPDQESVFHVVVVSIY